MKEEKKEAARERIIQKCNEYEFLERLLLITDYVPITQNKSFIIFVQVLEILYIVFQ
jgi:hypothetical protein